MSHETKYTCCFTGHRSIPQKLVNSLRDDVDFEIEKLYIMDGVRTFISGGAIGFDTIAAEAVVALKRRHPDARLVFALPCENHTKSWSDAQISKFRVLSLYADEIIYVSESYYRGCMHVRNRFMLENSEYCITYCKQTSGGTYYTVNQAKKMNKTLIEL